MPDTIQKVSGRMIDWAERLENASDAARGKAVRRRGFGTRWLLLPPRGPACTRSLRVVHSPVKRGT